MKSPIDIVRGRIVDIDKHGIVTIKARYDDWPMLLKREYKECNTRAYHVSQGLRVHLRRLRCRQGGGRERNAGPIRDGSRCKVNTEAESKKRHGRCSRRSHRARNNSPPMRAADSAAMNEVFTPVYECQYITKE